MNRREFIKILTGTVIAISLPMGLLGNKKEDRTISKIGERISCKYYKPNVIVYEYGTGPILQDLNFYRSCRSCKRTLKCPVVENKVEREVVYRI